MKTDRFALFLIFITIIISGLFVARSFSVNITVDKIEPLKKEWYEVTTPRGDLVNNATIVGNCWACHATWVKPPDPNLKQPMFAHPEVKLDHGSNDKCFNCHSFIDRNMYAGTTVYDMIPVFEVEKLCGKCHGIIYKNWLNGTHGATRGYWNKNDRFEEKVKCTECHDPHSPKYKFSHFAPAPVWNDKYKRLHLDNEYEGTPYSEMFPSLKGEENVKK